MIRAMPMFMVMVMVMAMLMFMVVVMAVVMAVVMVVQKRHGILPGLDPQGQKGTAVAVQGLRLAQQTLQIAASDHLLQGLPGRRVFVHDGSLASGLWVEAGNEAQENALPPVPAPPPGPPPNPQADGE
jgi:hypothetical protein